MLSVKFSQAIASGRRVAPPEESREQLLFSLLKKRAAASNAGAGELEALLRAQILWSLPTQYGAEDMIVLCEAA